jgi:hypothetical protein
MMNLEKVMNSLARIGTTVVLCALGSLLQARPMIAASTATAGGPLSEPAATARDGQHDFDFEIGAWKTHLKRLVHPLTGSTTWVEYEGTSVVSKVWDGRANLVELEVDGPGGHIEALSLRLYNPQARQWRLNFASSAGGMLATPTVGEFKDGRGEFVDQETFKDRAIFVRFVITETSANACSFEQAFSDDGGKTWEVNWIATDTRVKDEPAGTGSAAAAETAPVADSSRESLNEAWWTGPILAASGGTLPRGHMLIEPYFYDVRGSHSNGFGSSSYVLYGLGDGFTAGSIPSVGYNKLSNAPSGSSLGNGDFTLVAQHGLTAFHQGNWIPTSAFVVEETLPTGKYDNLGNRASNGLGAGAYTTTLGYYPQTFFWLPNGRILRMRFDLTQTFSSNVNLEGVSVYGTGAGFSGHAKPGDSFTADPAWEYSLTQKWVLALDAAYKHNWNTRVVGRNVATAGGGLGAASVVMNSGSSEAFEFAPAVEYNWRSYVGVIGGVRVIPPSHGTNETITPVIAINFVH